MATLSTSPPGWYADPVHRHEYRYWDGNDWTEHVADAGVRSFDALAPAAAPKQPSRQDLESAIRKSEGGQLPKVWPDRYEPVITSVLSALDPGEQVLAGWRTRSLGQRQHVSGIGLVVVTDHRVLGADHSSKGDGLFVIPSDEVAEVAVLTYRVQSRNLGGEVQLLDKDHAILGNAQSLADFQVFKQGQDPSIWRGTSVRAENELADVQKTLVDLLPSAHVPAGERSQPAAPVAVSGQAGAPAVPLTAGNPDVVPVVLKYRWREPVEDLVFAPDVSSYGSEQFAAAVNHYHDMLDAHEPPLALYASRGPLGGTIGKGVLFTDRAVYLTARRGDRCRIPLTSLARVDESDRGILSARSYYVQMTMRGQQGRPQYEYLVTRPQPLPGIKEFDYTGMLTRLLCDMTLDMVAAANGVSQQGTKHEAWFHEGDLRLAEITGEGDRSLGIVFPERCVACLAPATHRERWVLFSNILEKFDIGAAIVSAGLVTRWSGQCRAVLEPGVPYCGDHKPEKGLAERVRWTKSRRWDPHFSGGLTAVFDKRMKRPVVKGVHFRFDNPYYVDEFCAANNIPIG